MTSFMARTALHILTIRAAKAIKEEIEKAGLDNLKILAENGVSIVGTYLQGCSPQKQAELRQGFNSFLAMGVTLEMVLDEIAFQIPEIGAIMKSKEGYKTTELQKITQFLKGD